MSNPSWFGRNQTSNLSIEERFWEKVDIRSEDECWNWMGFITPKGYGHFREYRSGMTRSHRFSWKLYNKKEVPDGMLVCHTCDNRRCVNPKHLFLGTNKDNMQDMSRKGRGKTLSRPGELSPLHKLTEKQVKDMRNLYSTGGYTYFDLAKRFGISFQNVGQIITRKRWNHV